MRQVSCFLGWEGKGGCVHTDNMKNIFFYVGGGVFFRTFNFLGSFFLIGEERNEVIWIQFIYIAFLRVIS